MPRAKKPRKQRRGWGSLHQLPSGRWRAAYTGPDVRRHAAPYTFDAAIDGEAWLAAERRLIVMGEWTPPKSRARQRAGEGITLATWAPLALERRRVRGEPLRPRTLALYRSLLSSVILPELGEHTLTQITPDLVAAWYDHLDPSKPTRRAHAYALLRTVMAQAIEDERHPGPNPCRVKGAGQTSRARAIRTATPDELEAIAAEMPERLRLLVLLAGWAGLRFGELAELRRRDLDVERGTVTVSRGVVRVDGRDVVGPPKSAAGVRTIDLPPHIVADVAEHLAAHVDEGPNALVFPRHPGQDRHLIHTEVTKLYKRARTAAGRPDLRLHDLRHTAAVLAAQAGATLAELQERMGHSTTQAAMRYQHAAEGRGRIIAAEISRRAGRDIPRADS